MAVFCLVGKKRSGKTEISNYLSDNYKIPVIAFAKKLKDLVADCSGLNDSYKGKKGSYPRNIDYFVVNKELKKWGYGQLTENEIDHIRAIEYHDIGEVYRLLLNYIGTNIFRTRNPNHWIYALKKEVEKEEYSNGFICDDCRFLNEFEFLKNNYDIISIKVTNSKQKTSNNISDSHISEVELENIKCQHSIVNEHDGVEKLINKIKNVLK